MKIQAIRRVSAAFVIVMIISGAVFAAKALPKNTKNKATKGTTQLKSNYSDPNFGQTFTLGKSRPINITLNSAEYTVEQVRIGSEMYMAKANEKLLVLHYTLHNPNQGDYGLAWHTLEIFGVDANDKNWRFCATVGIEGTGENCNMDLKPGQKTRLYTVIKLPAKDALPKLVIQSGDRLVLRYNLLKKDAKGKYVNLVKPLPAPIADPADPTGNTALEAVPAELGVYYPLKDLDAKLDSVAFSDAPIKNAAPAKGQRYLVLIVTARNERSGNYGYAWHSIEPKLNDQDGGSVYWNSTVFYASRDETVNANVEPGKEIRTRCYFSVPAGLLLKSVSLQQSADGRKFVYDLTALN